MEKKKLMELFAQKIALELQLFKSRMIKRNPEKIYGASYQIECMERICEILMDCHSKMEEGDLEELLVIPNLLSFLYTHWLEQQDALLEGLQNYVRSELMPDRGKVAA